MKKSYCKPQCSVIESDEILLFSGSYAGGDKGTYEEGTQESHMFDMLDDE